VSGLASTGVVYFYIHSIRFYTSLFWFDLICSAVLREAVLITWICTRPLVLDVCYRHVSSDSGVFITSQMSNASIEQLVPPFLLTINWIWNLRKNVSTIFLFFLEKKNRFVNKWIEILLPIVDGSEKEIVVEIFNKEFDNHRPSLPPSLCVCVCGFHFGFFDSVGLVFKLSISQGLYRLARCVRQGYTILHLHSLSLCTYTST
jgi:hypothetical protein